MIAKMNEKHDALGLSDKRNSLKPAQFKSLC